MKDDPSDECLETLHHELNYSPYLAEMAAANWGMEYFDNYLRGKQFTLLQTLKMALKGRQRCSSLKKH